MTDEDPRYLIPPIHESLIALLEQEFPVCLPTPGGSERMDVYCAGQRKVVQYLIDTRDDQLDLAREQSGIVQ